MAAILILVQLLVLHRVDGQEVTISPNHVTSLRAPAGPLDRLAPSGSHCLVGLTDGKFVSVIETCLTVRRLLEGEP
jgi:hypothetical protein